MFVCGTFSNKVFYINKKSVRKGADKAIFPAYAFDEDVAKYHDETKERRKKLVE
ncbi:hypothetical protein AMI01nite_31480 [Aneurinibacillus migulanus]|nr:hypothetical protein AMI01nite_31480 [Aneurinibacillus migulanus]